MFGPLGAAAYGVLQPVDELTKALGLQGSKQPSTIGGVLAQVAPGVNVQPGVRELVDDLIEENVLGITTPDVTPTTFDATPTVTAPAPVAAPAQPAGPSAADIERQKQAAINARLAQQATARQQQQAQEAARQAQAAQAAEVQAAVDRVAAAQEVQRFMQPRAYQEEGAELTPAMLDALAAGQVDTFANISEGGGAAGAMGGYAGDPVGREAAIEARNR